MGVPTLPHRLRLVDHLRPGAHFYLERQQLSFGGSAPLSQHHHDFCECFWVETGHGCELREDEALAVEPADLVLLRPEDCHTFRGPSSTTLVLWNLAFPAKDWQSLCRRHAGELRDWFALPSLQRRFQLGPARCRLLCGWAREITAGSRRRLDLERLLLLLDQLLGELPGSGREPLPDWLASAVEAVREPRWFASGPAALVRLSGRSPEHVARSVRKHLGMTPTQLVNEARLAWAAERLAGSHQPVLEIALACGWQNLGCFYRSFRARFGIPPCSWRERACRIAGA